MGDTIEAELTALRDSNSLRRLAKALTSFNAFDVMKTVDGEIRHSNVLAWLLQPHESHGLGDAFLRGWLVRTLAGAGDDAATELLESPGHTPLVRVQREWNHIDLLVRITLDSGLEWVIAIENKVRATQSVGQLRRYRERLASSFPNARCSLVFLTLNPETPDDPEWLPVSYAQVREALAAVLADESREAPPNEPRVFIQQYLEVLGGKLMKDEKLTQLARSIYAEHRRALDFIRDNLSDTELELSTAIADLMRADATAHGLLPRRSSKGYVRFLPSGWNTDRNLAGRAWGEESAFLLCELVVGPDEAVLKIVEGQAPPEWREALYTFAVAHKPVLRALGRLPAQWMSVYYHRIPMPLGVTDTAEQARAIWAACLAHVTSDPTFKEAERLLLGELKKLPA